MDKHQYKCLKCDTPIDYKPEYCCDGRECGCMGKPLEIPLCEKCEEELMGITEISLG